MMGIDVQDRRPQLAEHLQLLRSLGQELERAMSAIARDSLVELEDSVAAQQTLSGRLVESTKSLNTRLRERSAAIQPCVDVDMMREIRSASGTLHTLNQRYAALLQHSSRSVELMVSLFSSFKGQFQKGAGPRLKQQTWSCQV